MLEYVGILLGFPGTTLGGSCNWYMIPGPVGDFGIVDGGCISANIDGDNISALFICNGSNGYIYDYYNSDCRGEATFAQMIDHDSNLYSCNVSSSGCDTVDLMLDFYNNDSYCTGNKSDDYMSYLLINQISCTEFDEPGYYFTLSTTQKHGVEINIYSDSDCSRLYYSTVTISDGGCDHWWNGQQAHYTLDDSGAGGASDDSNGSETMSNNSISICNSVIVVIACAAMRYRA